MILATSIRTAGEDRPLARAGARRIKPNYQRDLYNLTYAARMSRMFQFLYVCLM